MSYKVDRFNGTFLVNVADGTIDNTTDLRFIGRNYAGYGEVQNENMLHLLEHFANTNPPSKAITGQIWYDSNPTQKKLKFYDSVNNQWKTANGAVVQSTPPSGLTAGELWFNTALGQLNVWNGTAFILIGPQQNSNLLTTQVLPAVVKDTTAVDHNILRVIVDDITIQIISSAAFTLSTTDPASQINGFGIIKKGVTLTGTDNANGITVDNGLYWGTASSALGLIGDNGELLKWSAFQTIAGSSKFVSGLFIGQNDSLQITTEGENQAAVIRNNNFNESSTSITLRIQTSFNSSNDLLVVQRESVVPGQSSVYDFGSINAAWKDVYAVRYFGNLVGDTTGMHVGSVFGTSSTLPNFDAATNTFFGQFGSTARPAVFTGTFNGSVTGQVVGTATDSAKLNGKVATASNDGNITPDTIVLRDSAGSVFATQFVGISTRSNQLLVGTTYRSAAIAAVSNTIAGRDSAGNLTANVFNGTATAARYADLAEKYLTDVEYVVGTVVVVGGESEVTASSIGDRAVGVVSANPAFMMNKDLHGGTYIALKGRVPVRVVGAIAKGQRLVAGNNGCALKADPQQHCDVFAIALEHSETSAEKIIECVIL